MNLSLICIGLLGLLSIALGFAVSTVRGRTEQLYGYTEDPENFLYKLIRAHGNTTEYVGVLAVLIYVAGLSGPATWVLWTIGIVTLSRYLLVIGILVGPTLAAPHPLRFLGALGTYVGGLALSISVLMQA